MERIIKLCAILGMTAIIAMTVSCAKTSRPPAEEPAAETTVPLEPLATTIDREVVPEIYPVKVSAIPDAGDSLIEPGVADYMEFDSALTEVNPSEVYRVQIFTSRLFAEASREQALANEIFNQPVHLDYEVPYYKLRVGDFLTREEAENMVSEIRSIGYRSAWVARVVLRIKNAPLFDERDDPILPSDIPDTVYLVPETADSTGVEETGEPDN
ncbi:MAG: SPOR domain-containing protein [candidate division Zixibacteria bacterium]|nr:SPOR domain-containing protein [candidate division Zixibacteria bacterium]